jgi:hypothetical protein
MGSSTSVFLIQIGYIVCPDARHHVRGIWTLPSDNKKKQSIQVKRRNYCLDLLI